MQGFFASFFTWYRFFIFSIACAVLCLGISTGSAHAFFDKSVGTSGNIFALGTLGITLNTNVLAVVMMPDATSTATFFISPDTSSIASRYEISAEKGTCADTFWNGVKLKAQGDAVSFEGMFSALAVGTTTAASTMPWTLSFVPLPGLNASIGETCTVTLHVRAWQIVFPTAHNGGFSVEKTITLTLTAGAAFTANGVVLNEILPNPEDSAPGILGQEFIELYNNSDTAVDVLGWQVSEMSGSSEKSYIIGTTTDSHTVADASGSTTIASHGFLVLQFHSANKINDTGDTIRLYNGSLTKLDEYAFSVHSANDSDSDSNATPGSDNTGGGSETVAQEGKSHARIPDGTGAWVDPIPTPGDPNQLEESIGTETGEGAQGAVHDTETENTDVADADVPADADAEHDGTAETLPPATEPETSVQETETPEEAPPIVEHDMQEEEPAEAETSQNIMEEATQEEEETPAAVEPAREEEIIPAA